jgi:hypothetical protein
MNDTGPLQTYGPTLIDAGYLVVPVYHGRKNPIGNDWRSNPLAKDTLPRYNGAGIGLLAGTGEYPLCILDIDCSWEPGAKAAEKLAEAMLGVGLQRVGNHPKQALVYLADEAGWTKEVSKKFQHKDFLKKRTRKGLDQDWEEKDNFLQIEILGAGQQAVAYGTHPDTEKDYTWTDISGGAIFVHPSELPTVMRGQVRAFVQAWESWMECQLLISAIVPRKPGERAWEKLPPPATGTDLAIAGADRIGVPFNGEIIGRQLMAFDPANREEWMRVGWALHHEFEASVDAFNAWVEWSRGWALWDEDKSYAECEYQWSRMHPARENAITWRTILKAQAAEPTEEAAIDSLSLFREKLEAAESPVDIMGEVCEYGSITLPDNGAIRAFAVSSVLASLATFPGGSMITKADVIKALRPKSKKEVLRGVKICMDDKEFLNGWKDTPDSLAYWAWSANGEKYINTYTGRDFTREGFDGMFMQQAVAEGFSTASAWVHTTRCIPHADACLYLPGKDSLFIESNVKFINQWSKKGYIDVPPNLDDPADYEAARLLEKHISLFFGGLDREAQLFCNFLRYCIDHPGKKIRWAPLLVGPEGDGKSFFSEVMRMVIGHVNVGAVGNSALRAAADSGFNSFMNKYQLLFVEEVKMHGHNKYDIFNTLKEPVANTSMGVIFKGKEQVQVPNSTNWILLSNHRSCMPLTDTDRRYLVLWSKFPLQWMLTDEPQYFDLLFRALEESPGGMAYYLKSVPWHEEFQPNGRAAKTPAREQMIAMSGDERDEAVVSTINNSLCWAIKPDLLIGGQLLIDLLMIEGTQISQIELSRTLERLGYIRPGFVRVEGTPVRGTAWSREGLTKMEAQTELHKRYLGSL